MAPKNKKKGKGGSKAPNSAPQNSADDDDWAILEQFSQQHKVRRGCQGLHWG